MRMDGESAGHRAVGNKGRGIGTSFDDSSMGQMHSGTHTAGESQDQVNRVQDYGVSSVPLPPTGDWGPEPVYSYHGGARSHPTAHAVDDRRHRPMGQAPGESFQYDHQGQGTYVKKTGTYIIGGGHQGQEGYSGDPSSNVASMRHVVKQPQQRNLGGGGAGGGTSLIGSAEVLTPDGFKNIQDIKLGDKIISYPINGSVRKNVEDRVVGLHVALTKKQVVELVYEGGRICCTYDHEIWTEPRNRYVTADKLGFIDKVRTNDVTVAVVSLIQQTVSEQKVFDLTVETNRNFYAREGSSGVPLLVHNASGGSGGASGSAGGSQQGGYNHEGDSPTSEVLTYKDNHASMGSNSSLGYAGQDPSKGTYYCDTKHAHVRFMDQNVLFCNDKGIFSTKPIQVAPFPYKVQSPPKGSGSGGGAGAGSSGGSTNGRSSGGGGGGARTTITADEEWEIDYRRRCRQFWWAQQISRFKYASAFVLAVLVTNYLMASFVGPDPTTFVNSTVQQIAARLSSSAVAGESQ